MGKYVGYWGPLFIVLVGLFLVERFTSQKEKVRLYNLGQLYSQEVGDEKSYEKFAEQDGTVKIIEKELFNYGDDICYVIIVEGREMRRASFFVLGTDPYIVRMYSYLIVGDRVRYKSHSGPVNQPTLIRQ